MQTGRNVFPFTAIVGQDLMKQALILNAINPAIGGVLIRGEKGTAKSTAVRSLTKLLPGLDVVADCRYGCPPDDADLQCSECTVRVESGETLPRGRRRMRVVELPINASEDRVVGAIDIEAAIKRGEKEFEPGVLAEANRNILYVDEVNLLDDHIVDVLLDAAAMGQNTVEREGVSVSHPSRFILVGTMNPEEGELRPQLLDRFGLCVDVEGIRDVRQRVEIVERREAFEEDPTAFAARFEPAETARRRIGSPARCRCSPMSWWTATSSWLSPRSASSSRWTGTAPTSSRARRRRRLPHTRIAPRSASTTSSMSRRWCSRTGSSPDSPGAAAG